MSPAAPAQRPAAFPDARDDAARVLIERQQAMLMRLAEIGMQIAEAAGRRAASLGDDAEAGTSAADPALSYARAARAVRLTIALQSRLAGDLAALGQVAAKARAAEAGRRRDRIHRHVEQAIAAEQGDDAESERLSEAAWERLTEEDDADLASRPVAEVVAQICRDLGLSGAGIAEVFAVGEPPRPALKPPPGWATKAGSGPGAGLSGRSSPCEPREQSLVRSPTWRPSSVTGSRR